MKLEALNNTKIIPPATVELYNVGGDIPTSLPSHLLENSDLVRLAGFRRRLNGQFDKLFQQISDPKTDFNQVLCT